MTPFDKARTFIHRNARPLDLARWRFHFEGGSAEDVLAALAFYQNADGGFGHAIEPDCWMPGSWPIGAWAACCILREVDAPREHPIVQGVLRYLDSGKDFDESQRQWLNTVPGANGHPHATWWTHNSKGELLYNPTASLAGFALHYASASTPLYRKAQAIAQEAIDWLKAQERMDDQHSTACFMQLWDWMHKAGLPLPEGFEAALHQAVGAAVCTDAEQWRSEYVCHPSSLIHGAESPFLPDIGLDAAQAECAYLLETQGADGAWPVVWRWWTDYPEFEVAANWWKSPIIIERMLYLRGFGMV